MATAIIFGDPCKYGHESGRYISTNCCVECIRLRNIRQWKRWYAKNHKKVAARKRNWYIKNRAKVALQTALRRAHKLNATPWWLTEVQKRAISKFYEQAQVQGLTVDHIIPLRGKAVCGLHVPWNLQLLTKSENSQKGVIVGAT